MLTKVQKIIIGVSILLIIGGIIFAFLNRRPPTAEEVTLEFWGVFDDSDVFGPLIADFNEEFPRTKINYRKKTYQTYEKDLLEAMASGRGPDIFMIHHTWLPRYQDKVYLLPPNTLMTIKEIQDQFVDVVYDDFVTENGRIAALPLSVDTLALYYNKDIFNTVGLAQPPATWQEFIEAVRKITIKDEAGNISRAGAALGTAKNINRATDILCLLMLQSGAQMTDPQKRQATFNRLVDFNGQTFYPGEQALRFYTDFANPLQSVYTWNNQMHYSIDAFYEGRLAMMFNYAYNLPMVKAKAPYLNFGIAPMPQPAKALKDVNYANYWGLAVSRNSQSPKRAWQFIVWLTQKENAQKYLELAGRPTARRDLVNWQKNDPELGVFALQSLSAFSWYQVDNSTIEKYLADMIESIVSGQATLEQAIDKAVDQITLLMSQF